MLAGLNKIYKVIDYFSCFKFFFYINFVFYDVNRIVSIFLIMTTYKTNPSLIYQILYAFYISTNRLPHLLDLPLPKAGYEIVRLTKANTILQT